MVYYLKGAAEDRDKLGNERGGDRIVRIVSDQNSHFKAVGRLPPRIARPQLRVRGCSRAVLRRLANDQPLFDLSVRNFAPSILWR